MNKLFFLKTAIVFILSGFRLVSIAQVCTGSLGDPVVNVTFGSGTNPGSQLQAATTTYSFTSSPCPNDGSYTVVNSTSGCFSSSWYTIPEDHTPNEANGYMMLVNASYNPGDFYVDTVKNLCANTNYEFAAWIVNVQSPTSCNANPIVPKLVFNIETTTGVLLGTYSTGNIPSPGTPTWKQYGLFFTTPVNTSIVVIRLTNTAPGGCGNDLALDDITFRPCGPSISAGVTNNNQSNVDMCIGSVTAVPLSASIGTGYIAPAYQWQESKDSGISWTDIAGETALTYVFNKTAIGVYKCRMSAAEGGNIGISNCRVASNPVTITIRDIPAGSAQSNSPVCEKRVINLTATGGTTYAWSGPAGFSSAQAAPSFIAQNNSGGQYNVIVTDQFGCSNSASTIVVANPKPTAVVSNTQEICAGNGTALQAAGGTAYLWSPATGLSAVDIPNPIANPVDTTSYRVIVTSVNNCADTAMVTVNVIGKPIADAGPDKIIFKGQTVILDAGIGGGNVSFTWSPATFLNDPLLLQPSSTPLNDVLYTLEVISNLGCGIASDDVFVKVYNDIYIPTAFSPNNDGLNDVWRIDALVATPEAKVLVYNRYGNIVFETTGNSNYWDGTFKGQALPTGAYPYLIDFKNGSPLKKGTVTIVR
jgi:gliding motility-associated-like protein